MSSAVHPTEYSNQEERAILQERHYQLLKELQNMSRDLSLLYQQRMPTELLSDLASCLLDQTIPMIVSGLKDIQIMKEKSLFEKRQRKVEEIKGRRASLGRKLREEAAAGKKTQSEMALEEESLEKECREELHRLDMKTVLELDQVVSDQQVTLEKAGVPGFHVTNNPTQVRLQMYIIDFIMRLGEKYYADNMTTKHEHDNDGGRSEDDWRAL